MMGFPSLVTNPVTLTTFPASVFMTDEIRASDLQTSPARRGVAPGISLNSLDR